MKTAAKCARLGGKWCFRDHFSDLLLYRKLTFSDEEEFKMIMRAGPQQRAQDEHARQPDGGETSDDASRAKLVSDTEPDEPPPVAVREQVPAPAPAPAASEGEAVAASDVKIWM